MRKPDATQSIAVDALPAHVAEVLQRLRKTGQAVVITENGEAAAVLISPADFDWLDERRRFVTAVEEGMEDARAGRLIGHDELVRQLDEEFGPLDERG